MVKHIMKRSMSYGLSISWELLNTIVFYGSLRKGNYKRLIIS